MEVKGEAAKIIFLQKPYIYGITVANYRMNQETSNILPQPSAFANKVVNGTSSGGHCHFAIRRTIAILVGITVILFCCHLVSIWASNHYGSDSNISKRLDQYFNLNNEDNFPSFFSALILFLSSALLFFIHKLTKNAYERRRWLLLALVFLFMSIDEAIEIHERLEPLIRRIITNDADGYLTWTWVVPYVLLALALAVYCFRFVMQLPKPTRNNFILSGCIYVLGAAGIESLEGHLVKHFPGTMVVIFTTTVQELMEMTGIILFIYGLLSYLAMKHQHVTLTFGSSHPLEKSNSAVEEVSMQQPRKNFTK